MLEAFDEATSHASDYLESVPSLAMDEAAQDEDHYLTAEERFRVAMGHPVAQSHTA